MFSSSSSTLEPAETLSSLNSEKDPANLPLNLFSSSPKARVEVFSTLLPSIWPLNPISDRKVTFALPWTFAEAASVPF